MRIAVTADGSGVNAMVDPRFGRCGWIALFDSETQRFEPVQNEQHLGRAQGAGIQTAQRVAGLAAEVVLTGHCGPNAFRVLDAARVRVFTGASGTISQAVEAFEKGELTQACAPDVEGHWL